MQGYGHIDEVAALYGLMWNTPKVMCSMMSRMKGEQSAGKSIEKKHLWGRTEDKI